MTSSGHLPVDFTPVAGSIKHWCNVIKVTWKKMDGWCQNDVLINIFFSYSNLNLFYVIHFLFSFDIIYWRKIIVRVLFIFIVRFHMLS